MDTETGEVCKCNKNTLSKLHKQISKKRDSVPGRQRLCFS